jgi:hypothetical protein
MSRHALSKAPELADGVAVGSATLDSAYKTALDGIGN